MRALFIGVLFSFQYYASAAVVCSEEPKLSCPAARAYDTIHGKAKFNADACCIFWPGVMDVYQKWDEKRRHWVIDRVELATCDGYNPMVASCAAEAGRAYSPSKMHNLVEGYARHITPVAETSRSLGWGNIDSSATDDEVAARWVDEWNRYGSCISTWNLECFDKTMPPGEEEAWNDPGPALFVQTMNELSRKLMRTEPPSPYEASQLPKRLRRLKFYGSPHFGNFVEDTIERDEVRRNLLGKLTVVAKREMSREEEHKREFTEHEEL